MSGEEKILEHYEKGIKQKPDSLKMADECRTYADNAQFIFKYVPAKRTNIFITEKKNINNV